MPPLPQPAQRPVKTSGLSYWMRQVLEECDRASVDFDVDAVHDLRVALRRCRSMADGLRAIDRAPEWKAMKKAGRDLFRRLGALRDVQVMMEWVEKLEPATAVEAAAVNSSLGETEPSIVTVDSGSGTSRDPAAESLLKILAEREKQQKREARLAVEEFDRKQWRQWARSLPARAAHMRPGSGLFKHLALERWMEARALHTRALRNRSQVGLHTLRIAIKRFRYIVENFLPVEHQAWSKDLKQVQDVLGEVHDLDVLWATALSCRVFDSMESRKRWHARIVEERAKRISRYRERMAGPNSLWEVWRAGLPHGIQVQALATRRMKTWANLLDPDFAHSQRVAKLSTELYDGLVRAAFFPSASSNGTNGSGVRSSLQMAALLHDVGKSQGIKGHHKASLDLIRSHAAPVGWNAEDMRRAAIVARFHCGALPTRSHKALRDLLPDEQKITIQLAAVLRLANSLDAEHDGHIRRVGVAKRDTAGQPAGCVVVEAEGYSARSAVARTVAAERHLLETVLRRPVMIRAMKSNAPALKR